jgi:hypothetical protein
VTPASNKRLGLSQLVLLEQLPVPEHPPEHPPPPLQLLGPQSAAPHAQVVAHEQGEHQERQPLKPSAISQIPNLDQRTPDPFIADLTSCRYFDESVLL